MNLGHIVRFSWTALLLSIDVKAVPGVIRQPNAPVGVGTRRLQLREVVPSPDISLEPVVNQINWVEGDNGDDGDYSSFLDDGSIKIENISSKMRHVFQIPSQASGYSLNADKSKALVAKNNTKQYRYSFFANYFIQDVKSNTTVPLHPDQSVDIRYAAWSPKDPNTIAFVWKNNIHIWNNGTISAVTKDGGTDKFYGVTDWVYEEEVMGPNALWFSPDGEYIAFLGFDDSKVPLHAVSYYMDKQKWPRAYPKELEIRYPKPGFANPIVNAGLVKVSSPGTIIDIPLSTAWPADNIVVGEVAWITGSHEHLILRCFNRVQNRDKHILFQVGSNSARIVRERDGTDGWISNTRAIKYVGEVKTPSNTEDYYLDLSDQDGWSHIYLYPVKGGKPVQVTSGNWEVRSVSLVDKKTSLVHYLSTEQHPTQSHLYTVSMATLERKLTVNNTKAAFFDATFSSRGDYFVLSYLGPNVPYQEVYATNSTREPIRILEDNANLVSRLDDYALPTSKFFDMQHPSGFNLSARLIFPPNFSPDKKYPILLTPYGGPGSQEVRQAFGTVSYPSYLASDPQLEYVTFTVDNRGTGWRGRRFRNTLAGAMGTVDADDQIWAAQKLAADNPWVDTAHIGIWGWSNGGRLSAKVVERGSDIISFAAATAPTSDYRLYDSIYAERYMGLPQENADAYDRAAIRNATGFKNIAGRVLIQHGTGDDNVHFGHTAALFDMLVGAGVPPEKVQATFFTDSDHGIRYNRANEYLFKQLTRLLREEKDRVPVTAKKYRMDPESELDVEEKPPRTKPNILQDPQYTARFRTGGMFDFIMS